MEFRKMLMITLYAKQKKRHRCIEQSFVLPLLKMATTLEYEVPRDIVGKLNTPLCVVATW